MKTFYTLTFLLAYALVSSAQGLALNWAESIGGNGGDNGEAIAVDGENNILVTGSFQETIDLDPGPGMLNVTAAGSSDIFILKLSSAGELIWAKSIGGSGGDAGAAITIDGENNILVTGYFTGTADFDPGPGTFNLTAAGNDIFILKLSPAGILIWAKRIGGPVGDNGNAIVTDNDDNIIVTGAFQGTVDFDPGPGTLNITAAGSSDIFILKLNPAGELIWVKSMGGSGSDQGNSIAVTTSGAIYTGGQFNGTADFDPGAGIFNLTSAGGGDSYIAKLDPDGSFIWAKRMGGTGTPEDIQSICVDGGGNVYGTGRFFETADFDPGPGSFNLTSAGFSDAFVVKLDTDGNFVWAKQYGGSENNDWGHSVSVDAGGKIYVAGIFMLTVDFDPGPGVYNLTSAGGMDLFVTQLDASGNFIWATRFGGTGNDARIKLYVGADKLYFTGHYQQSVDFEPGGGTTELISAGSTDIFVAKYSFPPACSGIPVTASVSPASSGNVCGSPDVVLTLAGLTPAGNYSFQWKLATSPAGPWTNAPGASGYDSYSTPPTPHDPTYYRCEVTCPTSGQTTPSIHAVLSSDDLFSCYCITDFTLVASPADRGLTNVTLRGETEVINNPTGANTATPSPYTLYATPLADLVPGETYTLSTTAGTNTGNVHYVTAWIDYDRSGTFGGYTETGFYSPAGDYNILGVNERIIAVGPTTDVTTHTPFTVPASAWSGLTAMRVRYRTRSSDNGIVNQYGACEKITGSASTGGAGEVEDYRVLILPPCAGAPTAAVIGPAVGNCANNNFSLKVYADIPAAGYTYQWKQAPSPDGPWVNAPGDLGQKTYSRLISALPYNPTWYRCEITCPATGQTTASSQRAVYSSFPVSCYCDFTSAAATVVRGLLNVTLQGETKTITNPTGPNLVTPSPYSIHEIPVADLKLGNAYTLSTTVGTATNNLHYVAAWIDYDQDGVFGGYTAGGVPSANDHYNAAGELERITTVGPTQNVITNSLFTVPANAKPGLTAMRVRYRYGATLATWGACQQITGSATAGGAGEVEDYRVLILPDLTEWTGITSNDWNTASNWSTGVPMNNADARINAVIPPNHQPVIDGESPVLNNLTVEAGAILSMSSGENALTINGELINDGEIRINNGASLVQGGSSTLSGSGTYKISRQGLTGGTSYNFWSSPVSSSPVSVLGGNRYYYHTPSGTVTGADDTRDPGWKTATGNMAVSNGYASTGSGLVTFSGTVNNAPDAVPLEVPVTRVMDINGSEMGYNLVGNPFPSAVDPSIFLSDNAPVIEGTVWLWNQPVAPPFSSADYATITALGATAGGGGTTPEGYIPSCQGFFVHKTGMGDGVITFKNTQRAGTNTQFFSSEPVAKAWFSAVSPGSHYNEMLVGFKEDATEGFDHLYDGRKLNPNPTLAFYSLLSDQQLAIQALPPLQADRRVQLGYTSTVTGEHSILLKEPYGFPAGTRILLEDTKENLFHNFMLSETYSFHWVADDPETRFILHFYPAPVIEASMALCGPDEGSITLSNSSSLRWQVALQTGNAGAVGKPVVLNSPEPVVYQQLPPGLYTVIFTAPDGYTFEREIVLPAPQHLSARFTAEPEAVKAGEPVHFTAQAPGHEPGITWDFGDGTTSEGISSLAYLYEQPGIYTVSLSVKAGPCFETESKRIRVTEDSTTSVAGVQYTNRITAFPNPAGDWLNIVWNTPSIPYETVRVSDSFGRTVQQLVLSGNTKGNSVQLDLRGLAEGIYMVALENGKERSMVKIMVNDESKQ